MTNFTGIFKRDPHGGDNRAPWLLEMDGQEYHIDSLRVSSSWNDTVGCRMPTHVKEFDVQVEVVGELVEGGPGTPSRIRADTVHMMS